MKVFCVVGLFLLGVYLLIGWLRCKAIRDSINDPLDIEDRIP